MRVGILFIFFFVISCQLLHAQKSSNDRKIDSIYAAEWVVYAIEHKDSLRPHVENLPNLKSTRKKEEAIKEAEKVLFKIYGKKQIVNQKPYRVFFIKDHWYMGGTLPKGRLGGTFMIIFSSVDGKVIEIIHGK